MSVSDLLAAGRAAAEVLMVDRCTVRRVTGKTTNTSTGEVTPTYAVVMTNQACKVQARGNWGESRDVGEANLVILSIEVHFPVAITSIDTRDEITIDASVHDPDLVGRVFRVRDIHHKSFATARRLMCQEVTG